MAWLIFLGFVLGWLGGWLYAHRTVATECDVLGKFYVGRTVYHCTQICPRVDSADKDATTSEDSHENKVP